MDHAHKGYVYADLLSSVCTLLLGDFQTVSEVLVSDICHHSCMATKPCGIVYIHCGRMFVGLASGIIILKFVMNL